LDFCEGNFTPQPRADANVKASDIHEVVKSCSPHAKRYTPGGALQADLDAAGTGVTLDQIGWPDEIDDKFKILYDVVEAIIALYALAIFFSFMTILISLWWFIRNSGRCSIIFASLFAGLTFICVGVASGAVTAIGIKGVSIINQYGGDLSIVATRGNKFLAMTWAATGCALIAWFVSTFGICLSSGSRRERRAKRVSV
jgi:SUR7/PalI family